MQRLGVAPVGNPRPERVADALYRARIFVGGAWTDCTSKGRFRVVSPATEEELGSVPAAGPEDVDSAVTAARVAFDSGAWAQAPIEARVERVGHLRNALASRIDLLADLLSAEVGIPTATCAAIQVHQPLAILDYYLELASAFEFEESRAGGRCTVVHEPVGVVAAIVPWNAPVRSIMNKLAPALLAGCSVIVKAPPETPLAAMVLADALAEAEFPPGVVSVLAADGVVSDHLVRNPGVDKVAFTGSSQVGRLIMAACAERVARVSLELGGKSAAIILDDADLTETMRRLTPLIVGNNGEACTAQTRILAPQQNYDAVLDALVTSFARQRVGDPFDEATTLGPLVSSLHRDRVERYFEIARSEGASFATGGDRPADLNRGWYVNPTVVVGVGNGSRIAQEEIFGPVAVVVPYVDVRDAVRLANESPYGLSGSVWTADQDHGDSIARAVRTGTFSVNGARQPLDAPFGGYKQSGIGREYGLEGFMNFVETKAIASRSLNR